MLRSSARTFRKVLGSFEIYMAGKHAAFRDAHMLRARAMRRAGDLGMAKLFADFARDEHREYLKSIGEAK